MGMITIEVWDAMGSRRQTVEVPDDKPINRILVVLIERLKLPIRGTDGQFVSYKFYHQKSRRQLQDYQTFFQASVQNGDVLRLQPEITAGRNMHP